MMSSQSTCRIPDRTVPAQGVGASKRNVASPGPEAISLAFRPTAKALMLPGKAIAQIFVPDGFVRL